VTDFERKILYARMDDRLRVAAMVDLVGEDLSLDPQRLAGLQRAVRQMFPQAADFDAAESWAGLRPATPGGTPILGATPISNLWLNVGHGALASPLPSPRRASSRRWSPVRTAPCRWMGSKLAA
jgi:D-amino-acid dehydrogenase